jgi:two-component system, NarL family, nitrate/nitrite sensor histidine kinase NarX
MHFAWNTARLTTKIGILGAGLLVTAVTSIGLTLWIGLQLEGGAAAVNEAGRPGDGASAQGLMSRSLGVV